MKIFLLFLFLLTTIGIASFIFYVNKQEAGVVSGVSTRTKEYIENKKKENDTNWQYVNLQTKEITKENISSKNNTLVTTCLTVMIPFEVERVDHQDECTMIITVYKPKGTIVIVSNKNTVDSYDDISHVRLRRAEKDEYDESSLTINRQSVPVFKSKIYFYEKTGFMMKDGNVTSVTIKIPTNQNLDKEFKQVLSSLKYL